jgi:hypothetical protein
MPGMGSGELAMLPDFLLPEQIIRQNGSGPALELGQAAGSVLFITLGINRIIEQESLDLSIFGSADGQNWGAKPIAAFPQKFYCGVYTRLLDLSDHPEVRFIRCDWKVSRWGRGEPTPLFGVYVFAETSSVHALSAAS